MIRGNALRNRLILLDPLPGSQIDAHLYERRAATERRHGLTAAPEEESA
jgi:hypothetical protein